MRPDEFYASVQAKEGTGWHENMTLFREWEAQKYLWVGLLNITAALLIIYILSKYRKAPTSKSFIFNSTKKKNAAYPQMDFLQSW